MRVTVTGAAGFIGSHVVEALARAGHDVLAVDALTRSSAPTAAVTNWNLLAGQERITRLRADLVTADLDAMTEAHTIVHLAGRPGVRSSWGPGAAANRRDNVTATRRLLAACAARPVDRRPGVVIASSSSVYGAAAGPCPERATPRPQSPYAAAKLAVERLAAEAAGRQVRTVLLRYFSVYGPRQRPDMAFHRFIEAALDGVPAPVLGDGTQSRSFTYVGDVVAATVLAAGAPLPAGTIINVGHAETVTVRTALDRIAALLGAPVAVRNEGTARGDVARTWAACDRAERLLGWVAGTGLDEGLRRQIAWHRARRRGGACAAGGYDDPAAQRRPEPARLEPARPEPARLERCHG